MVLGIVAQRGNDRAVEIAAEIWEAVGAAADVRVDAATAERLGVPGHPVGDLAGARLVVSIGGDGTFLYTARHVGSTPIVGVNLGEVGFLNAVDPDVAVPVVRELYEDCDAGDWDLQRLPRLQAEAGDLEVGPAINEILIQGAQRGRSQRLTITVEVDGETYATESADGVMAATPTGSTAYNLSEGGPVVTPDVESLIVNLMCGDGGMPPLIMSNDAELNLEIQGRGTTYVIADSRDRHRVRPPLTVRITRESTPVRIAGPPVEFFGALDKLDRAPRLHEPEADRVNDANGNA